MKYIGFAICLLCLWGISSGAGSFRYENCSKNNNTVIAFIENLVLSPDPVILNRGNVSASAEIKIIQDVPEDTTLRVRFYKLKKLFGISIDIPIPCILGKFGSCTLPLCKYLEMYREQAEPFFQEGAEYGCPLKAGTYGGQDATVKIPYLGIFGKLLVSGKYRAELEAVSKKQVLVCYKIFVEMN